jgi:hypothetical protein
LVLRGTGDRIVAGHFSLGGSRYAFVPVLLLTAAFIAVADSPGGRRWLRVLPAVVVFGVVVANAGAATSLRGDGPDWPKGVAAARARCHSPDQVVAIPSSPHGWQMTIACRLLTRR